VSGYDTDCVTGKIASRSVETEAKELSLELYPNPVEENLTITIPNNELSSTIRITTITGETFLERKIDIGNTNTLLSLKGFPAGVYIVQVKQAHEIYSSKIVKQ
jgi:hypothetical protein